MPRKVKTRTNYITNTEEGKWYDVCSTKRDDYCLMGCCDCGLVHRFYFLVKGKKIKFCVFREEELTKERRKSHEFPMSREK